MSATDKLDLYVTVSGPPESRPVAIGELVSMFPLEVEDISALEGGAHVMLRSDVSRADAETMAMHLESVGFVVELRRRGGAAAKPPAPPIRPAPPVSNSNAFFDAGASIGLVGLDGDDGPDDSIGLEDPAPRFSPPAVAAAPPTAFLPPAAEPPPAPPRSRFAPDDIGGAPLDIGVDRPASEPTPYASSHGSTEQEPAPILPRCPSHGVAMRGDHCPSCAAEAAALRGKLFGGKLRSNPTQRLLIGVGAGLFVGWIVTTPIARRAQMRVDDLREQSAREHARPTEEAAQHAAQLDARIEEQSQSSVVNTFAVWGLIAAAVTAAWMKLT
ncbi:MAG: hypothetical protein ABI321_18130 [Polyangia bacterium]